VVVGLAGAATYYFVRPPQYTANLTMYVSSQGADATQALQGAQLSQDRVASYTELVTGPRVLSDVIVKLGLHETTDVLAKQLTATNKLDSVLIDVAVTDQSPRQAATIANSVGDVFPALVDELERPTEPGRQPAVAVRIVQPAPVPTVPSSTGSVTVLAIGLLAGLAIGVGLALVRNTLDVSVKTAAQLSDAAGVPNLGTIAFDPKVSRRPLMAREDPQTPRAESLRQLRTNLQFVDVDRPRRVLVVTSALPGEGKTTTTASLAQVLESAGSRVLLIEADLRRPQLSEKLGLDRSIGLTSVLSGRVPIEHAIQPWGGGTLEVLASGPLPPNPSELLGSRQMQDLLTDLRERYDVILIDTPPLLPVTDAASLAPSTDGVLLICRFKETNRTQVEDAAAALRAVSAPLLGTVLSMAPVRAGSGYGSYGSYRAQPPQAASTEPR